MFIQFQHKFVNFQPLIFGNSKGKKDINSTYLLESNKSIDSRFNDIKSTYHRKIMNRFLTCVKNIKISTQPRN